MWQEILQAVLSLLVVCIIIYIVYLYKSSQKYISGCLNLMITMMFGQRDMYEEVVEDLRNLSQHEMMEKYLTKITEFDDAVLPELARIDKSDYDDNIKNYLKKVKEENMK